VLHPPLQYSFNCVGSLFHVKQWHALS